MEASRALSFIWLYLFYIIAEFLKFLFFLVGGDFNMDMKSYDLKRYSDFLLVPYRPVSGNLAKDLKNSFVFTFDSLQVRNIFLKWNVSQFCIFTVDNKHLRPFPTTLHFYSRREIAQTHPGEMATSFAY